MEFYSKPLLQDHVMPFSSLKSLEHVGSQPIKVDINFISCVLCYVYTQHRNPRIIYIYRYNTYRHRYRYIQYILVQLKDTLSLILVLRIQKICHRVESHLRQKRTPAILIIQLNRSSTLHSVLALPQIKLNFKQEVPLVLFTYPLIYQLIITPNYK